MRKLVWILACVLLIIHQDFWFRDDRSLVFGFMPIGLAYHAMFSIAAACVWTLAVKYAWPSHIEWADDEKEESSS
jgi:hypothetical protein